MLLTFTYLKSATKLATIAKHSALNKNFAAVNMDFQPNPMILPNIVANILQHISPDTTTLEKLRRVCHCWNHEASIILRQTRILEFTTFQSLQSYINIFKPSNKLFDIFPHSKYKFALRNVQNPDFLVTNGTSAFIKLVNEFLECFASFITSIYLPIQPIHFETHFLDMVLGQTPNITTLGLEIKYFHNQQLPIEFSVNTTANLKSVHTLVIQIEGLELSEVFTDQLLSVMFLYLPNLQTISIPGDIKRISKPGLLIRDIVLDSESSDNLLKLGVLDFKTRLLEEHCLKLLCKTFPIKTLHADFYNPDEDESCVNSDIVAGLFRKWNKSLQHLEIEFPFRKEISFHFHFPVVMENLRVLYLGGFEGCLLDLLKNLPSLHALELSQLDLISILPKPEDTDLYSHVRKLRLDFCNGQTAGILSRFSRIFPQLQVLDINHASNQVARMVFQKMNHLCRLVLQGDELTDATMCGFSEYATKENGFLSLTPKEGIAFRKYPYIADLKELRYLKLDAYALTEVTVRHALVHCQSLQLVKLDCTAGGGDPSTTVCRTFRLSEYENHLVEDAGSSTMVEMKEEPELEAEAIEFFQSHGKYSDDLLK